MCSDPAVEGFVIEKKVNHEEVETSSCETILLCATKFTKEFPEFHRNSSDNLTHVVGRFDNDIETIHMEILNSSVHMGMEENWGYFNTCKSYLSFYRQFANSFYDMVDLLNQTDGINTDDDLFDATSKFQTFVHSYIGMNKSFDFRAEVLKNCFWFEKHFWWRCTGISECYRRDMTKGVEADQTESDYLAEINKKLNHSSNLNNYCHLEILDSLTRRGTLGEVDPYYVEYELCINDGEILEIFGYLLPGIPSKGPLQPEGPKALDPNCPVFKNITRISC